MGDGLCVANGINGSSKRTEWLSPEANFIVTDLRGGVDVVAGRCGGEGGEPEA
jgi:hypothetical protein